MTIADTHTHAHTHTRTHTHTHIHTQVSDGGDWFEDTTIAD